jgi:phosphoribosylglycinamide formyltransferase-1
MTDNATEKASPRIAVFASGGGSNFEALARAAQEGDLQAAVVLVVTDRPEAGVRERAVSFDIPSVVIRPRDFEDEAEYVAKMLTLLDTYQVGYVTLAGYLKKIPSDIVRRFRHRMTNIHPALLPSFGGKGMYGRRVHEAVLEHGVRWTGVTVHLVDEEYDTGPIILQEPVPVHQTDSVEELAARVLQVEHQLYPRAVRLLAEGRLRVEGRRVLIQPQGG